MPALRLVRIHERVRLPQLWRHLVPAGPGRRSSTVAVRLDQDRTAARRRRPFHADPWCARRTRRPSSARARARHHRTRRRGIGHLVRARPRHGPGAGIVRAAIRHDRVRRRRRTGLVAPVAVEPGVRTRPARSAGARTHRAGERLRCGARAPGDHVDDARRSLHGVPPAVLRPQRLARAAGAGRPRHVGRAGDRGRRREARTDLGGVSQDHDRHPDRHPAIVGAAVLRTRLRRHPVGRPRRHRDVLHDVGRRGRRHPPGELRPNPQDPPGPCPALALPGHRHAGRALAGPGRAPARPPRRARQRRTARVVGVRHLSVLPGPLPSADLWRPERTPLDRPGVVLGERFDLGAGGRELPGPDRPVRDRGRPQPRAAGPAVPGTDPRA